MRQYVVRIGEFFLVDFDQEPNFRQSVLVGEELKVIKRVEMSTNPDEAHLYDKSEFAVYDASRIPGATVQIIEREMKFINFPEGDGSNE